MRTIWKYALDTFPPAVEGDLALPCSITRLEVPKGAIPVTVRLQNGRICLWFLVDDEHSKVTRVIHVAGTGQPFPELLDPFHHGSVQQGQFVWHVYEERY